jgi:O-antigen ligase
MAGRLTTTRVAVPPVVWLAAGGSLVVAAGLALRFHWGWWAVAPPLLVLGALQLSLRSVYWGAVALVLSAFVDRPEVPLGPVHLRVGELVALGLAAAVALRLHAETGSVRGAWSRLRTVPLFWPVTAFLASNFVSVAFSLNVVRSIQLCMILTSLVLGYVALAALRMPVDQTQRLLMVFAVAACLEAVFGLALLLVAARSHSLIYGIQRDIDTRFLAAMGSLNDANFFGSFLVPPFLLVLAALTIAVRRIGGRWLAAASAAALFVLALAIFASLTRGAWLGLLAGVLTFGLLHATRALRPNRRALFPALAVAVVIILAASVTTTRANLAYEGLAIGAATIAPAEPAPSRASAPAPARLAIWERVQSAFDVSVGSTRGRIELVRLALEEWKRSPWFGTGTGSFDSRLDQEGAATHPWILNAPDFHPWILNMFVTALHDTGPLGLLILLWLLLAYFRMMFRAVSEATRSEQRALLAGMTAGAAGLFVAFQASTGLILLFPWLLMGLGVLAAQHFALPNVQLEETSDTMKPGRGRSPDLTSLLTPGMENGPVPVGRPIRVSLRGLLIRGRRRTATS